MNSSPSSRPTLRFLGGAETVTGSKYWIRHRGQSLLLECGMFQGLKSLRLRNWEDPPFRSAQLAAVVQRVVRQRGVLIIPAFAVGRTQEILWRLDRLERQGDIPSIPVFIDSPMATDVTGIYCHRPDEHDLQMQELMARGACPLRRDDYVFVRTREESRALNRRGGPMIIVAASGMAAGGRVLHHLEQRLPHPENIVLLVGYQAAGTRGRSLLDGAETVKIHGRHVPVRAAVEKLDGLSAHADQGDIDRWLDGFQQPPARVFLVHGEPEAARGLAEHLTQSRGWNVEVARDEQQIVL